MVAETQKFVSFVTEGIKVKQTQIVSSKCFFALCKSSQDILYKFTEEIIQNVLPTNIDDWKCEEFEKNIIGSLAILICRVADENEDLCTFYLKQILQILTVPLVKNFKLLQDQ